MSSRRFFSGSSSSSVHNIPRTASLYPSPLPRSKPASSSHSLHPRLMPSGKLLHYLRDHSATDEFITRNAHSLKGPLGFDIEYPPTFRKGVPQKKTALVQIASDNFVLLIHVSAMSVFPVSIKSILEDPDVIKAGVGIQADAAKLRTDFGINTASYVELGQLARGVDPQWTASQPKGLISLVRLVKTYQDRVMRKSKRVQLSNWSHLLTEAQQDYAADDAESCLAVLKTLLALSEKMEVPPAKSTYIF